MTIVRTSCLGDRLTIWDLRLKELNHHLIVVLQTPFEGTQVELTLTGNDHLTKLFGLLYYPSRIFFVHTGQESCQFLSVGLGYRLDCTAVTRLRINDRSILVVTLFRIQRVTRTSIFELHSSTDVTCLQFIYGSTDRTGYLIELRDTLFRAALHVQKIIAVTHGSLHYAEVVHLTDVRLNGCLKDIQTRRSRSVRTDLLAVNRRITELCRARSHTVQEVHQTTNTHIFETRAADNRIHRTVRINALQTLHDLFVSQTFAEELIQQRLICFCGLLLELLTHLCYLIGVLSRDVLHLRSSTLCFPNEHLALEDIDSCVEACSGVYRELDQRTLIAKVLL